MLTEEQKRAIEAGGSLRGLASRLGISRSAVRHYRKKLQNAEEPQMTAQAVAARARCPYFQVAEGKHITCDGPLDGSSIRYELATRTEWAQQVQEWCCGRYEFCEIFRATDAVQNEE